MDGNYINTGIVRDLDPVGFGTRRRIIELKQPMAFIGR
jgi:hypothetical protein